MDMLPQHFSVDPETGARRKLITTLAITLILLFLVAGCASPWQNESADLEAQDSEQALTIKAALIEALGLAGSAIDVAFTQGRATLTGFVETQHQRDQALAIVKDQERVNEVVDEIVIK